LLERIAPKRLLQNRAQQQTVARADALHGFFMTGGAFTGDTRRFLAQISNPSIDKPLRASKLRSLVRSLIQ